jgi:hypothetical protein
MDVQTSISHPPALYQRPAPLSRESMPYVPSLYPYDIVDYVEIPKGRFSPANATVTRYISFTDPTTEKGLLIDLFV